MNLLRENSWESRVEKILELIDEGARKAFEERSVV
jgi:hypothetical protein